MKIFKKISYCFAKLKKVFQRQAILERIAKLQEESATLLNILHANVYRQNDILNYMKEGDERKRKFNNINEESVRIGEKLDKLKEEINTLFDTLSDLTEHD